MFFQGACYTDQGGVRESNQDACTVKVARTSRGQVALEDMSGPVGIVSAIGDVVSESRSDGALYVFLNLANWGTMISANLGVVNLLPIPALDGGRLVFLIIEAIRRKPVPREKEGMVHFIGIVLLMVLMVVIMANDIRKLF